MKRRSALDPRRRIATLGPPPSMQNAKREPADEQITIMGPQASSVRTIRSQTQKDTSLPVQKVGVPDKARAEKGMSLALMLRKQPKYLINSAEDVVVKKLTPRKTKGGMPAFTGVSRDLKTKPMRPHKFQILGMNKSDSKISTQKRIKISCDCEFFMYYSEYALWTWGAANIRYSNGQPAVVRNPGNHPVLCKHLVQVLETIRKNNL